MSLELVIPEVLMERLRREGERTGACVEEVALEALYRGLGKEFNPSERVEVYGKLSEKYLAEADSFLGRGGITRKPPKSFGALPR